MYICHKFFFWKWTWEFKIYRKYIWERLWRFWK